MSSLVLLASSTNQAFRCRRLRTSRPCLIEGALKQTSCALCFYCKYYQDQGPGALALDPVEEEVVEVVVVVLASAD